MAKFHVLTQDHGKVEVVASKVTTTTTEDGVITRVEFTNGDSPVAVFRGYNIAGYVLVEDGE